MFSTKESKPHAARKRLLSHVYSKSCVQSSPELYDATRIILHHRLLPSLDSFATQGLSLEALGLNYAVTMDFVSSYLFGLSSENNFIQDVEMRKRFLSWHFKRSEHAFWDQEIPRVTQWLQRIGVHLVPRWVDAANANIQSYVLHLCRAAEQSIKAASDHDDEKAHGTRPVVYSQLTDALKRAPVKAEGQKGGGGAEADELPVASEMLDHLIAGMDTSAITLTYLLWEMSRHAELQASLRKEVCTLSPSLAIGNDSGVPSARSLDALPLLHAVVMETLRLHCPIPGSQPRQTPSKPTSIVGSPPLPGGVRVSAQAYSLHRNENVFSDPEAWVPQRWLDAPPQTKDEMARWFWAFGSGGRMCVGRNFAMQGEAIDNLSSGQALAQFSSWTEAGDGLEPLADIHHRAEIRDGSRVHQLHNHGRRRHGDRARRRVHSWPQGQSADAEVHPRLSLVVPALLEAPTPLLVSEGR